MLVFTDHQCDKGQWEVRTLGDHLSLFYVCPVLPCPVLKSTQALMLEVQRIHLAQKIEELEWELSLLLQIPTSSSRAEGSQPSHHDSQHVPKSPRTQRWPPVGCPFYTKDTTTSPC